MTARMRRRAQLPLALGALALSGCVRLGPDFQSPSVTWLDGWNSEAINQFSQQLTQPDNRQWWRIFNDPVLDRLIAEADANNSNLKIAGLRVIEARAQLGIAESGRYPQVQQASAERL